MDGTLMYSYMILVVDVIQDGLHSRSKKGKTMFLYRTRQPDRVACVWQWIGWIGSFAFCLDVLCLNVEAASDVFGSLKRYPALTQTASKRGGVEASSWKLTRCGGRGWQINASGGSAVN